MTDTERRNISDLTPPETVAQVFMISQPVLRSTQRGDFYIAAFLSDKTGRINGRMWQASEKVYESLPQEGFVFVKGRVELYQNAPQLVIDAIRPVENKEVKLVDFMPTTEKDINTMLKEVKSILSEIKDANVKRLVDAFLNDKELMEMFCVAPAAILLHHAFIGGLLEHTLGLMQLAQRIKPQYPELNWDIIYAGVFLHDIGKTSELDFDISFKYTDQGRLIGHLVKGTHMIEEKIRELDSQGGEAFPRVLADSIEHIIVSHHGIREYGCPVVPATPEAFVVHYLDNLDSKIALTMNEIKKDTNKSSWTHFVKAVDSALFKERCMPEDGPAGGNPGNLF